MSTTRASVSAFLRQSYPTHAAHPHMGLLSDRLAGNPHLVRQLSESPVPSRDVYQSVLSSLQADLVKVGGDQKVQEKKRVEAQALAQFADELLNAPTDSYPHWAEIPRVRVAADDYPATQNLKVYGHPIETIPGLRRDANSGQIGVDKISAKEGFQLLAGRDAEFSDLGVLPQGEMGKQLVALRSLIANGKVWDEQAAYNFFRTAKVRTVNGQVERIEEEKLTSDELLKIRSLLSSIEGIKGSLPPLSAIIPAGGETAYFAKELSHLADLGSDALRFLVVLDVYPDLRLKAQDYLKSHSVALSVENPVLADLAYLATYDLNKYPATTVSAGQLKYMIVADKGEMGVRAVREAHAKGLIPVVLFSERDDANSLQVRLAREFGGHIIGLEGDFKATYASYIQIAEKVRSFYQLQFGDSWQTELSHSAIYPGYGPLAENAAAIRHFRQNGIAFTGPMEDVVDSAGDKRWFRKVAAEVDASAVTPGMTIDANDPEQIFTQIQEGYHEGKFMFPGRLKAANGGGGRGQVVVESLDQLKKAIAEVLGQIAQNGWADGVMFEQNIPETIHLEVQIMRDRYGNTRNFGMRDCSEQRASQKIQEEAPPSLLKKYPGMQDRILKLAMMIAEKVGYVGAGTIELMFKDGKFYFLEMNTRIQVEHPVSEMAFRIRRADGHLENVNLVQLQMMIANGEAIDFAQDDIVQATVAREFRINSESWRADRKDPRDGKMGIFVPNGGRFDEIKIPTQQEVLSALKRAHPENENIQSLSDSDLQIRFDSGFEVGDFLINKDPTFGKFLVSVSNEVLQSEDVLRLASIEALTLLKISGVEVGPDGKVAKDPTSGQTRPFMNNIADHIRLLNTRLIKNHANGFDVGRHVNAIVDILRNGENLDASLYPALFRASSEESDALGTPVVYAIHRNDPNQHYVDTPTVFSNPGAYPGILAAYLHRKKEGRANLSVRSIFGKAAVKNSRITGTLDADGRLMNAVLYRNDLPQTVILSVEMMGEEQILKIDLDYRLNSVGLHVSNLHTGEETEFSLQTDRKSVAKECFSIPGFAKPLEFEIDLRNDHNTMAIKNGNGDRILRVRPHMGNDLTHSAFKLVETLNDKKLSVVAQKNVRAELQQRFVDMAIAYGTHTRSREVAVRHIAKSPYNLTTEVAKLALAFRADDQILQANVRSLAHEILFYRYFESRFHHVSQYEQRLDGDQVLGYGLFDDDKQAIVPQRASRRQAVIATAPVATNQEQVIEETLQKAWRLLQSKTANDQDIIEVWVPQHLGSDDADDAYAKILQGLVNKTLGQQVLRRVTFMVYAKLGEPTFKPGDGFYTFRPTNGEAGLYEESTKFDPRFPIVPRHEHPMVSEQMERWRWKHFNSILVRSQHSRVQITEVTGLKNAVDKRHIFDAQIREKLRPALLPVELINEYLLARVSGKPTNVILGKINLMENLVPADLPERLDSFILWALFCKGLIDDPAFCDLVTLRKEGVITNEVINQVVEFLKDKPFYDEAVDEVMGYVATEMKRLHEQDEILVKKEQEPKFIPHSLNRVRIFMQNPTHLSADYVSFLGFYLTSIFNNVDLDKVTFHYHKPINHSGFESRVMKIRGIRSPGNYLSLTSNDILATDEVIKPKAELELKTHQLHRKGNMTLQEKLDEVYDQGLAYQELLFENGFLIEKPFVASRKEKEIRGFVGLIGGRKTYVICADPLNSNIAFDAPDGDYIKAFIDRTMTERDEDGKLVGAPLIKIEELSAGANLYDAKKKDWSAAVPLDQFGKEFQARYDHARLSGRPNLTTILSLVIGGGIYGPKASHEVIAMEALSVAALTGGNAAGYATGGKPGFVNGKLMAIGGSANFSEAVSGSSLVHGKNGVYTNVVTLPKLAKLLATLGADANIEDVASLLTAKDKIELQKLAYAQTRRSLFFMDDNLAPLLPENHQPKPARWKKPAGALTPIELLQALAEPGLDGQPLMQFWNARMGQDLLCGWVALPVLQADGSLKVESVAFMMTNPEGPNDGLMTTEALRKAEEFAEVNSRLGRAMLRHTDFASTQINGKDSEFYRLRVLEQFSSYRGAILNLSDDLVSGKSQENYLQVLSQGLLNQRQEIAHFNGVEAQLIGYGVDHQYTAHESGQPGFVMKGQWYDVEAAKVLLDKLKRCENLARLIDKLDKAKFRVTSQGDIHFYAVDYSPEQFLRLHSLQTVNTLLGRRALNASAKILSRGSNPADALRTFAASALNLAQEMRATESAQLTVSAAIDVAEIALLAKTTANSANYETAALTERARLQRISRGDVDELLDLASAQNMAKLELSAAVQVKYTKSDLSTHRPMEAFARYMSDPVFGIVASGDNSAKSKHLVLMNQVFAAIRAGQLDEAKGLVPQNSILHDVVHNGLLAEAQNTLAAWFPGQKSIAPSFEPVLADMALKGPNGKALYRIWKPSYASDLLCAWLVLPIKQSDGTLKPEVVSFMMNDITGEKMGAITTDACRKAEEFLEMNSRMGLPMIRLAGSPGFYANDASEREGIEQLGKRAMDKVIAYQGPIYTLEIAEDCGGARIFMGSITLGADGHIVTDSLSARRLAALPTKATAGIKFSKQLAKILDDSERMAAYERFAQETVASGTAERAQKAGAVRNIVLPVLMLDNLSSGIAQARVQRTQFETTQKFLDDRGVSYDLGFDDGKTELTLGQGKVYSGAKIQGFINSVLSAERLARLLGLAVTVTVDGQIKAGQRVYDAEQFIDTFVPLARFLAQDGELPSSIQAEVPLSDTLTAYAQSAHDLLIAYEMEFLRSLFTAASIQLVTDTSGKYTVALAEGFAWSVNLNDGIRFELSAENQINDSIFSSAVDAVLVSINTNLSSEELLNRREISFAEGESEIVAERIGNKSSFALRP